MNAKYLTVLLFFGALGQHANATVIAIHENAKDPESEGWTHRGARSVDMYPIHDDEGSGVCAWAIHDNSGDEAGYRVQLTPQEIDEALRVGWKLSVRLRVVAVPEILDRNSFTPVEVLVGNGASSHFGMAFSKEIDGSPLVNVGHNSAPVIIDLDDLDSGYHLYELEFDPTTNRARLFVDGALRASSIKAFPSYMFSNWDSSVNFGSTFSAGSGSANYSLVKYELVPEPTTLVMASLGPEAVALLRVRRSHLNLVPVSPRVQHKETTEEYETFKQTQAELMKAPYVLHAALRKPQIKQLSAISSQEEPIGFLSQKLDVSFPGGSEIMRVSLYCGDDEQSVTILSAIVDSYLEEIAQSDREDRTKRLETLQAQYRVDKRVVQEKWRVVYRMGEELGVSTPLAGLARHETEMLANRRAEIWQQWSNAKLEVVLAEASTVEGDSSTTIAAKKVEFLTQLLDEVNQDYEESKAATANAQVPGFATDLLTRGIEVDSMKSSLAEMYREIRRLELSLKHTSRIFLLQPAIVVSSGKE